MPLNSIYENGGLIGATAAAPGSGMFNLNAVFAGLPRYYDYEVKYGTANYTITTIPSTDTGVSAGSKDVLIAVDANFAATDDGVIIDLGGSFGAGFSAGLLNGNLRVRGFRTTGDTAWNTDSGAAEVEVDITTYCGSAATYYFVVDASAYNLKVFVQPGGKGSTSKKILLGSDTADGSEGNPYGSAVKGYGQVNGSIADLTASYEVTYNGSGLTEIRYWAEGITTIDTSNFEAENG